MEKVKLPRLALIGPMGSGKSALMRRLATFYGATVLDTDAEFERRFGAISDYFKEHGEAAFRAEEEKILIEVAESDIDVIATGGGAVLSKRGMAAMRAHREIAYLSAPLDILIGRVERSDRPLKGSLEKVVAERSKLYEKYADYFVDSSVDSLSSFLQALAHGRRNRYDVVLCDSDDTLLDFSEALRFALLSALDGLGIRYDAEKIVPEYRAITKAVWERLERGEITRSELFDERERMTAEALGVKIERGVFNAAYRDNLRKTKFVRGGAIEFLDGLSSRGVAIYIITNADVYCASERLKPLLAHVNGAFISEEIGYAKPDAKYFEKVFEKLGGVDKERVIVFGDSESSDIAGGINYGLDTCKYCPNGCGDTAADYCVTDYSRFLELI